MTQYISVAGLRSSVTTISGAVEIVIPSRRQYWGLFIAPFFFAGWWTFGATLFTDLKIPRDSADVVLTLFLRLCFVFWLLGAMGALLTIAWTLWGRERVRFSCDEVVIADEIFVLKRRRSYPARDVRDMRVVEPSLVTERNRSHFDPCRIAFDCGSNTVRFGSDIDLAEAHYLVGKINAVATSPDSKR